MKAESIRCTVRKSEGNWWVIERADHDGRVWYEEQEVKIGGGPCTCRIIKCSSRLGNLMADIEGNGAEMLDIASAIEAKRSVHYTRCEAVWTKDGVLLSSPRNSDEQTLITHKCAMELAKEIRRKIK